MSFRSRFTSTLSALSRRQRLENEMDAELRFHMDAYVADQVRMGVDPEEANRRARVEFGAVESLKEECREARGLRFFDELVQDLRYAARGLRKNLAFTMIATLTLALGVGANTSIFSLVNAWVLQPLPYPDADRLVDIHTLDKKLGRRSSVSAADLEDWRAPNPFFDGFAGWRDSSSFTLATATEPEQVDGAQVNADFFRLLGVRPALGRDFSAAEDTPGAAGVAILSDSFWRSHFGADPATLGRSIECNGRPVTVVGILPPDFLFPLVGRASMWMPFAFSSAQRQDRGNRFLQVVARVKPGVDVARARAYLEASALRLEQSYPASNKDRGVLIQPVRETIGEQSQRDAVLILFGIVGCVLLIACTNVANLMFGRAAGRQKEMAVRLAIGAGRFRLMRQLLTENVVLFLLGATFGVLLAMWGVKWLANSIPLELREFLPNAGVLKIDLPVLLYSFAVAALTGLVFGFAPALNCLRVALGDGLKESGSRTSTGGASSRVKKALVVFEISLALIVLVASGLLTKSMLRMYSVDPGFQTKGLVTAKISLPDSEYADKARVEAFFANLLERVQRLPRVETAAASQVIPFVNINNGTGYFVEGRPAPPFGETPRAGFAAVTPDYLTALGLPLLHGRFFTEQDRADSTLVVVINRTMAQREWPGEDPIGQRIRLGRNSVKIWTVAGVVQDVKVTDLKEPPEAQLYLSYRQFPMQTMYLVLRTSASVTEISGDVRKAVSSVDKNQAVYDWATMEKRIMLDEVPDVIVARTMSLFAAIALILAAIGIYGVISYSVASRRRELGVRMALGAGTGDVLSLILGQGLRLTLLGLAVGLAGAFAATRVLSSLLFQVSPRDFVTFATVSGLLALVALIACYVPARRAAGTDPVTTLRYE
ncbi:MAG TPA: ABC transporter permease [Bryobacteraceae bacterium]|nr:ABC transporter permease [Bryobacteraceae bacterium]